MASEEQGESERQIKHDRGGTDSDSVRQSSVLSYYDTEIQ